MHAAKETPHVDDGVLNETMDLLVGLIPYMRYACRMGACCEGGFGVLVVGIEKVIGSTLMLLRARMGIIDPSAERPW